MASFPSAKSDEPLNNQQHNKDAESNGCKDSQLPVDLDVITINVFFDGTGNNMFNTQHRLDDEEAVKNGNSKSYGNLKDQISYENDFSNVALLYKAAEDNKATVFRVYIEGAGTIQDQEDDRGGLAAATGVSGIMDRVKEAFDKSNKNIYDKNYSQLIFNVFGFSRGSFYGRYFVALLKESPDTADPGPGIIERGYSKVVGNIPVLNNSMGGIPIRTDDYDFKNNGRSLLKVKPTEININLLGIYDTVASHGWNHHDDSIPFKLDIGAKQQINKVIHLTAQNEYRNHFALVTINTAQADTKKDLCNPAVSKPIGFECSFPGAHADIGGGYIKPYPEGINGDKGLYLSVYDDPFEVNNFKRDMGEVYWKWYVNRGYYTVSKNYDEIRATQRNLTALHAVNVSDDLSAHEIHQKKILVEEEKFNNLINNENEISSKDNYGVPRKDGMYGEIKVVNTFTKYEVRGKRYVNGNSYQYIPLEVMYDLAQNELNAVKFNNTDGLFQLNKNFTEVKVDPVLCKFRNSAIRLVKENYLTKSSLNITTHLAGLEFKESQYLYHEYIHVSLAAELKYGMDYFSSYMTNGSQDYNKDENYYPTRVIVLDNKSGVVNTKPSRGGNKRYEDESFS